MLASFFRHLFLLFGCGLYCCIITIHAMRALLRYIFHMERCPIKREALRQKLALGPPLDLHGPFLWVYACSVGESLSTLSLLAHLHDKYPRLKILLTVTTFTAYRLLRTRMVAGVTLRYMPYDTPLVTRRFLGGRTPSCLLYVETNLHLSSYLQVHKSGAAIALINCRVSPRSYARWRYIRSICSSFLSGFSLLSAQDSTNTQRLEDLSQRKVLNPGNLKYCSGPLPVDKAALANFAPLRTQRSLWLAASTHPLEEEPILQAHRQFCATLPPGAPPPLLVIAPRHPHRSTAIRELCTSLDLTSSVHSQQSVPDEKTIVHIGDRIGDMGLFFRICPVAFIGGSLEPIGGHNPLEPAWLETAILHGPHTFKLHDIYAELHRAKAARQIESATDLAQALIALLGDETARTAMTKAALRIVSDRRDALCATYEQLLRPFLPPDQISTPEPEPEAP